MTSYSGGKIKVIGLNPVLLAEVMENAGHTRDDLDEPHGFKIVVGNKPFAVAEDEGSAQAVVEAMRKSGLQGYCGVEPITTDKRGRR